MDFKKALRQVRKNRGVSITIPVQTTVVIKQGKRERAISTTTEIKVNALRRRGYFEFYWNHKQCEVKDGDVFIIIKCECCKLDAPYFADDERYFDGQGKQIENLCIECGDAKSAKEISE